MKKYLFAILLFISSIAYAKNDLAICCIFRNDAAYLPEWIEFHQKQGFEHFFLYNNLSNDNPEVILKPYIDSGVVELISWPYDHEIETEWVKIQCAAYMDGIKRAKKYKWCAFLDTDEFLFSIDKPLKKRMREYIHHPGVMVNWVMYGTSKVQKIPEGEKMIDHLVWRSDFSFKSNKSFKSIVQPKKVTTCFNPHFFIYKHNALACDENSIPKKIEQMNQNSVKKLRINHYWSRDNYFFHHIKLVRRDKWSIEYTECIRMESQMNEVYDPIISLHTR